MLEKVNGSDVLAVLPPTGTTVRDVLVIINPGGLVRPAHWPSAATPR